MSTEGNLLSQTGTSGIPPTGTSGMQTELTECSPCDGVDIQWYEDVQDWTCQDDNDAPDSDGYFRNSDDSDAEYDILERYMLLRSQDQITAAVAREGDHNYKGNGTSCFISFTKSDIRKSKYDEQRDNTRTRKRTHQAVVPMPGDEEHVNAQYHAWNEAHELHDFFLPKAQRGGDFDAYRKQHNMVYLASTRNTTYFMVLTHQAITVIQMF